MQAFDAIKIAVLGVAVKENAVCCKLLMEKHLSVEV
jgi:hypothetical protein